MAAKEKTEKLENLVMRARDGDVDAYGDLVLRFQDMAVGYAGSVLRDFDLARDAAQEAFIEAYRSLPDLRDIRAFPGWFRRILFKYCDRITRGNRLKTVPLEEASAIPAGDSSPNTGEDGGEMRSRVLEAVRALPEKEREVTTLYYINGYSQSEVSEFLEIPVTTVKSRLHSARQRLRERMANMVRKGFEGHRPGRRFRDDIVREISRVRVWVNDEFQDSWVHRIFLVDSQKRPLAVYVSLDQAKALDRHLSRKAPLDGTDLYTAFVRALRDLGVSIERAKLAARPIDIVAPLIEFQGENGTVTGECRIGDLINVAVRAGVPIFVDREVSDHFVLRRRDGKPLSPAAAWRKVRAGHHFPKYRDISEVIADLEKDPMSERARRALTDIHPPDLRCVPPRIGKKGRGLSEIEAWAKRVRGTELEGVALGIIGAAHLKPVLAKREPGKALGYLETAHEKRPDDAMIAFDLATAYTIEGRSEEALSLIEKFRFPDAVWNMNFEPLWDDPRFLAAVGPPRKEAQGSYWCAQFRMALYDMTTPEGEAEKLALKSPGMKLRPLRESRVRKIKEKVGGAELAHAGTARRSTGRGKSGGKLILEGKGMPPIHIPLRKQDCHPIDSVFFERMLMFNKRACEFFDRLGITLEAVILLKRTRSGIEGALALKKGEMETIVPIEGPAALAVALAAKRPVLVTRELAAKLAGLKP